MKPASFSPLSSELLLVCARTGHQAIFRRELQYSSTVSIAVAYSKSQPCFLQHVQGIFWGSYVFSCPLPHHFSKTTRSMVNLWLVALMSALYFNAAHCSLVSDAGCETECVAPWDEWYNPNRTAGTNATSRCAENSSYRKAVAACFACMDEKNGWRYFTKWSNLRQWELTALGMCN